jgi:hypothetical protein
MISLLARLRLRVAALNAQIMVSPWADSLLLLGYSLGAFVLRLLFIAASCVAQCKVLKLSSCGPKQAPEANPPYQHRPVRSS